MHPAPESQSCPEKEGLVEKIRTAMNQVISINTRELEAVVKGEFARLKELKAELRDARVRKDSLLDAYYRHLREHGC